LAKNTLNKKEDAMTKQCFNGGMRSPGLIVMTVATAILVFGFTFSQVKAEEVHLRLGTSKEGTSGYACGVGLSAAVKRNLDKISMEAVPTPGSTASVKILSKKGVDVAYSSSWSLKDAYSDTGPFAKAPITRRPLQGWYFFRAEFYPIVKADSDIQHYGDLAGKKVFPFVAGAGVYDNFKTVYEKLGLWDKMKLRQVGLMEAADALKMGTIQCVAGYHQNGGLSTASWLRDIDARLEFRAVKPTAEERKKIEQIPGFSCGISGNNWMRPANKKHNPEVFYFAVHYGFHPSPDISTDVWYQVFKTWIEKAETDLAPVNKLLKSYASDPLVFVVAGIDEARDLPVHPGTAKYLKEKGLWKPYWRIGELTAGVE
jgi:TRAP transporter TAXI family solute receptor